jgi:fatty acid desaturase
MDRHQSGDAVRITTASTSRNADIAARQRRYLIAMGIRTACFVAAIFVASGWWRWVLIVAALVLPYVAVVMANASSSKSDGFALLGQSPGTKELEAGPETDGMRTGDDL